MIDIEMLKDASRVRSYKTGTMFCKDGVGNDMKWSCNGYCGKKQPMVVSVGGPSLRARAHLGGE